MVQHGSDNMVVWNREELDHPSDPFELSMQFRIITEYAAPISGEAHFGGSYRITITGDKANGYQAVLN